MFEEFDDYTLPYHEAADTRHSFRSVVEGSRDVPNYKLTSSKGLAKEWLESQLQ